MATGVVRAALYFIAALTVVMTGPGRYGLDTILSERRERQEGRP